MSVATHHTTHTTHSTHLTRTQVLTPTKVSKITKDNSGRIAAAGILIENGDPLEYIAPHFGDKDMDSPDVINALVKDISRLGKKEHGEIYRALRVRRPASFFATNSVGTHFNILSLDPKERWELYRMVCLCKEDAARQDVLTEANDIYARTSPKDDHVPGPIEEAGYGQAEGDKLKKMRSMNKPGPSPK